MMDPLGQVFANLDRWRHFPAYQLERRADVFFSVFLPDVLAARTGVEIDPRVIPEFPLKCDLIWPGRPCSNSVKVDYVLFARDLSRTFFIELKTDSASRRERQDEYLQRAKEIGLQALFKGLIEIVGRTSAHRKYYHLLHALAELGLLRLPSELPDHLFPKSRPGLGKLLDAIAIDPVDPPIEIIYLQPNDGDGEATISFQTFADHLSGRDDPLSRLFAEHLLKWRSQAGDSKPS